MPTTEIDIYDLTHDGRGVGRVQGKACFVEGALPNETVRWTLQKSQRQYDEGTLESLLKASPDRVQPPCHHYPECGGCQIQHLAYPAQVQAKQERLHKALAHQGIEATNWFPAALSKPFAYRRRARLSVDWTAKKVPVRSIGFKHRASNQIVDVAECPVLIDELNRLLPHLPALLELFTQHQRSGITEIELSEDTGAISVVFIGGRSISEVFQTVPDIFSCCDIWYRSTGGQLQLMHAAVDREPATAPPGFMQANFEINQAMLAKIDALLDLKITDHLLDLFCGSGNFCLAQAHRAGQITGIEIDPASIQLARKRAQGLENINFRIADLFDEQSLKELRGQIRQATAVILDPPRAGAEALVTELCKSKPAKILYISCHPATFVRDAKILTGKGYHLDSVGLLDMFPQTMHAEVLGMFRR